MTAATPTPTPDAAPNPARAHGAWLVAYGCFLIAVGVAGYLSNPEKAKTALLSGGTFGGLSALWGVLALRGRPWAAKAALVTTSLLGAVFVWRTWATWSAWAGGATEKRTAAILISLMLAATLATLVRLLFAPSRR